MSRLIFGTAMVVLLASACKPQEPKPTVTRADLNATVTVTPGDGLVADGVAQSEVRIEVRDKTFRPVPGVPVSFTATGSGNVIDPPQPTNADGVAIGRIASTVAEQKTLTIIIEASDGSVEHFNHPSVRFIAGPASRLGFTVPPGPTQAGEPLTPPVQVEVQDATGNRVSTGRYNVVLTLQGGTTGALLAGDAAATTSEGQVQFGNLSVAQPGTGYTLTAQAAGLQSVTSAPFDITVGPPARLSFVTQPSNTVVGMSMSPPVQVEVQDAAGNRVSSNDIQVSLALSNANGAKLLGTTVATTSQGVAQFPNTSVDKTGNAYTLTASATGFQGTVSAAFAITAGPPDATKSQVSATPTTAAADGAAQIRVTVLVKDVFGNAVAQQPVTFSASGTGNVFSPATGSTGLDGTFETFMSSTKAEMKTVTATVASFNLTTTVVFQPGAPSASTSTVTASPSQVAADGTSTTTLTLTLSDAGGNRIAQSPVIFSVTGTGNTLTPSSTTTDANGIATATLRSTRSGQKTVTASAGTMSTTTTVTFLAGSPSSLQSTMASSGPVVANGIATTTFVATIRDGNGNPVTNQPVTFTATGSANTLTPMSTQTDQNGMINATLASTKAEQKTVTANVGTFQLSAQVTFFAGPPVMSGSSLTVSPTTAPANGSTSVNVQATFIDAHGNPVSGQPVTLSATGTANTFTPSTGSTSASGVFTSTLTSTRAETKTVNVTVQGLTLSGTATFTPGPLSAAQTTVVANPGTVQANGTSTTTVTVTTRDANGNPVSGIPVALSASGSNNVFNPATPSGTTNASGEYSATLASTTEETKTLTAVVDNGAFSVTGTVTFGTCTVLVMGDHSTTGTQDIADALTAAGMLPTVVHNGSINYTGTPAASGFNAVLLLTGNNYSTDMPAAGQTSIVNANAAGTGVVALEWMAYFIGNGQWQTLKSLQLLQRSSGTTAKLTFTLQAPNHPIWDGVPTTFTTTYSLGANMGSTLVNGGVQIASCAECSSAGVVVKDATGRMVQIAHAGNYDQTSANAALTWKNDVNTTRMLTNAVKWAARCQ